MAESWRDRLFSHFRESVEFSEMFMRDWYHSQHGIDARPHVTISYLAQLLDEMEAKLNELKEIVKFSKP